MKQVTAAVIRKKDEILVCQRPVGKQWAGHWEFPGGKVEANESLTEALKREIQEELGTEIHIVKELGTSMNEEFCIHFFLCTLIGENPKAREHEAIRFVKERYLGDLSFCPLDAAFIADHRAEIFQKAKRLFIALPIGEEAEDLLVQVQEDWKKNGACGRWIPRSNMHITLVFIGETILQEAVERVMDQQETAPFELTFSEAGHFGSLWYAGLERNRILSAYVRSLKRALKDAGIAVDSKPLKSHVTLLRNGKVPMHFIPTLPHYTFQPRRVILYESVFTPEGVIYRPLKVRSI